MRFLGLAEVIDLHQRIVESSGGAHGIRHLGALESAVAQPRMTFGDEELYPTVIDKAAALGFVLALAAGELDRPAFVSWLRDHVVSRTA